MTKIQMEERIKELEAKNASLSTDVTMLEAHVGVLYQVIADRRLDIEYLSEQLRNRRTDGTDDWKRAVKRELLPPRIKHRA